MLFQISPERENMYFYGCYQRLRCLRGSNELTVKVCFIFSKSKTEFKCEITYEAWDLDSKGRNGKWWIVVWETKDLEANAS